MVPCLYKRQAGSALLHLLIRLTPANRTTPMTPTRRKHAGGSDGARRYTAKLPRYLSKNLYWEACCKWSAYNTLHTLHAGSVKVKYRRLDPPIFGKKSPWEPRPGHPVPLPPPDRNHPPDPLPQPPAMVWGHGTDMGGLASKVPSEEGIYKVSSLVARAYLYLRTVAPAAFIGCVVVPYCFPSLLSILDNPTALRGPQE